MGFGAPDERLDQCQSAPTGENGRRTLRGCSSFPPLPLSPFPCPSYLLPASEEHGGVAVGGGPIGAAVVAAAPHLRGVVAAVEARPGGRRVLCLLRHLLYQPVLEDGLNGAAGGEKKK